MNAESRKKVGYARVSTVEQNLDMQTAALIKAGVAEDLIFTDKMSGGSMSRPGLTAALKVAQHENTEFLVWKLDRLGRTLLGIIEMIQLFHKRNIRLVSLTEGFDMGTPFGKAMVHFLAMFAELERDLIRERTMAGMARARERGEMVGRPIAMTPERIETAKAMLSDGKPVKDILPALKALDGPPISRSKVFQWVADFRALEPNEPTDDR